MAKKEIMGNCAICKAGMTEDDFVGFDEYTYQFIPHVLESGHRCGSCVMGAELGGAWATGFDTRGLTFTDDHGKSYTFSKKDNKPRFVGTGKINHRVLKGNFDY